MSPLLTQNNNEHAEDFATTSITTAIQSHPPNSRYHNDASFDMGREDFLRDLYAFMAKQGTPITKAPSLGYQPLDLYALYLAVLARGGMDAVTRKQEWKAVYQCLGLPTMSTSASYNTRTNYKKYLYLYELEHCQWPQATTVLTVSHNNAASGTASSSASSAEEEDVQPARFAVHQYIRIVSTAWEGAVFYGKILQIRYSSSNGSKPSGSISPSSDKSSEERRGTWEYYVHYNGWGTSHDEWMPEAVLSTLLDEEASNPESLTNPPPTRSSKSNRLIESHPSSPRSPKTSQSVLQSPVKRSQSAKPYMTAFPFDTLSEGCLDERGRLASMVHDEYIKLTTEAFHPEVQKVEQDGTVNVEEQDGLKVVLLDDARISEFNVHAKIFQSHSVPIWNLPRSPIIQMPLEPPSIDDGEDSLIAGKVLKCRRNSVAFNKIEDGRTGKEIEEAVRAATQELKEKRSAYKQLVKKLERAHGKGVIADFLSNN